MYYMDYSSLKEEDLITKSRRGDTKAFEEIIFRDSEYIFTWIMKKAKNKFLSEELFQITLVKCWNNIKKFKGDSAFRTWACAVARNLFIDHLRKVKRRNEEPLEFENGEDRLNTIPVEFDPLRGLRNKDLKIFLSEVMDKMSVTHRNVLHYFAIEELTYQEISKIEKCSIGTVMSRLFYARKKAQELIRQHKNSKFYCGND